MNESFLLPNKDISGFTVLVSLGSLTPPKSVCHHYQITVTGGMKSKLTSPVRMQYFLSFPFKAGHMIIFVCFLANQRRQHTVETFDMLRSDGKYI